MRKSKKYNLNCSLDESLTVKSTEENSPDDQLYIAELRLYISKILSEMDERDALALMGKYYYGYSTKELCEYLKVDSQNTMLSIIYRARKKFIQLLQEGENSDED